MPVKYEISKKEAEEIKEYRRKVKDKYTDRRMYAVQLRGEGMKNKEVAEKLEIDKRMVMILSIILDNFSSKTSKRLSGDFEILIIPSALHSRRHTSY